MRTRKSGLLALVLGLAVFGAACEDKTEVNVPEVPPVITLNIAPDPVPALTVGQKVQLVAVVSGSATQTATWSSSNTAVATVDGTTGLVEAKSAGVAVITAVSTVDATARDAVTIQVTAGTGGTQGQPSITIQSVTQGTTNTPVNPGNVFGTVNVTMNVDIPTGVTASAVRVLVDGTEVCRQNFAGSTSADAAIESVPQVVVCSINTAQLKADGTPVFANGTHTLKAEVVGPTNNVLASATYQPLVFNNTSALLLNVTAAKQAPDASGLVWNGGNLTVVVTPSIFNGSTFQTFTVSVVGTDTTGTVRTITKTVSTTGVAAQTVVFDATATIANGGLLGIEDATTQVSATGVTAAGNSFDNGGLGFAASPDIRYDDAAPRLTGTTVAYGFTATGFLGANATVNNTCSATSTANTYNCQVGSGGAGTVSGTNVASIAGVVDAGVDVVKFNFQVSPNTATTSYTTQTSVAAIGNSGPSTLLARLQVCDNLGNCKNTGASGAFGVDLNAPVIQTVSSASGVQTSPKTITVAAADTGATASGFPASFVQVQIQKDSASSTGADITRCVGWKNGNVTTTPDSVFAVPSSGSCPYFTVPTSTSFVINSANSGEGYYTVNVRTIDLAGNQSGTTNRFFLVDATAPTFSNVAITYTTGATTATVAGTIHDNVDLASWNTREQYTGVALPGTADQDLPFTQPTTVKSFGIPVQGNVTPNVTISFVRGIQATYGGAITNISGLGFDANDQAGNYGESYTAFATTASNGVTTTDIVTGNSNVTVSEATVCQTGTNPPCANTAKTSTVATATLVMAPTTTANPIQTVYFYYVDTAGRVQLLSSTSAFSLSIPSTGANANQRVFTYTSSAASAANLLLGTANIFAIGVDSQGDGVIMGTAAVTVQ